MGSSKYLFPTYVPPCGPTGSPILIVGETPDEQAVERGEPFVGPAGELLMQCLGRAGVSRDEVYLSNLCNYRPYGNKFELTFGTPELEQGLAELKAYIQTARPTVIAALGPQSLRYLTGKIGIDRFRGSILPCSIEGCADIKVIATYQPSHITRKREAYPIFANDIRRVVHDSRFREFNYPKRTFIIDPQGLDREYWTQKLCDADRNAVDIESVRNTTNIICVGFSPSPDVSVVFPTMENPVTQTPNVQNWNCIQRILASSSKKIFQFGIFDVAMLLANGYVTENYWWDTLVAQHAMEPELPRSLAFLTSVYTREPYYKDEGRGSLPNDDKAWGATTNKESIYIYNARDCCNTAAIQLEQEKELAGDYRNIRHVFDFEMSEFEAALHISNSGLLIDEARRELMKRALLSKYAKLQFILNGLAGEKVNVRSPKLKNLLYDKNKFGLPPRRNREGGLTTDEDAIVACITYCKSYLVGLKRPNAIQDWTVKLECCKLILEIRGIRQQLSNYVLAKCSADNRMRSIFKVAGPETGRWAAEGFIDGTGVNSQTFPRDPVDIPDELIVRTDDGQLIAKMDNIVIDIDAMLAEIKREEEKVATVTTSDS